MPRLVASCHKIIQYYIRGDRSPLPFESILMKPTTYVKVENTSNQAIISISVRLIANIVRIVT